jgi:hypothetical protein
MDSDTLLTKFKQYVISFITMLVGVRDSSDENFDAFEKNVNAATSFAEMPLVIHRIFSSTHRRDKDKSVQDSALQKQIYNELIKLCTVYMLYDRSLTPDDDVKVKFMKFAVEDKKPEVEKKPQTTPTNDSDDDSDYDSYDDMPELEHATPPRHHPYITRDGASFDEFLKQREQQAQNIQRIASEIPKRPYPDLSESIRARDAENARRYWESNSEGFNSARARERAELENSARARERAPDPNMRRFTETASRLDGAHANKLLDMLNSTKRPAG